MEPSSQNGPLLQESVLPAPDAIMTDPTPAMDANQPADINDTPPHTEPNDTPLQHAENEIMHDVEEHVAPQDQNHTTSNDTPTDSHENPQPQASTSTDALAVEQPATQEENAPMTDDDSGTFTSIEEAEREMMKELIEGQHHTFLETVRKLKQSHDALQEISSTHKNQKINAVKHSYQSEIDLIHNWFIEEKKNIQREMICQLRRKLEILNREQQSREVFQRKRLRSHMDPHEEALGRKRARKTPTALWNAHFMKFKRSVTSSQNNEPLSVSTLQTYPQNLPSVQNAFAPGGINKNLFPSSNTSLSPQKSDTSNPHTNDDTISILFSDHAHQNIYFKMPQLQPVPSKDIDEDVKLLDSILKEKTAEADIVQDEEPDPPSVDTQQQQQIAQATHAAFLALQHQHQQQLAVQRQMILTQQQQHQQVMQPIPPGAVGGPTTRVDVGTMRPMQTQQQQQISQQQHAASMSASSGMPPMHQQQQRPQEVYYLPSAQHILSNTAQFDTHHVDNSTIPSIDRMTAIPSYHAMVGALDQSRAAPSGAPLHFSPHQQTYIPPQSQHYLTAHGSQSAQSSGAHPPPPLHSPSIIPPNVNVTFPFGGGGHWPTQPQQMNGVPQQPPQGVHQHSPHSGSTQARLPPMEHQPAGTSESS